MRTSCSKLNLLPVSLPGQLTSSVPAKLVGPAVPSSWPNGTPPRHIVEPGFFPPPPSRPCLSSSVAMMSRRPRACLLRRARSYERHSASRRASSLAGSKHGISVPNASTSTRAEHCSRDRSAGCKHGACGPSARRAMACRLSAAFSVLATRRCQTAVKPLRSRQAWSATTQWATTALKTATGSHRRQLRSFCRLRCRRLERSRHRRDR